LHYQVLGKQLIYSPHFSDRLWDQRDEWIAEGESIQD
jgi:hypothetical protein